MTHNNSRQKTIKLFISYSHIDDKYRTQLESHLSLLKRKGVISSWHDRRIVAGSEWQKKIDYHLEKADIILLLISSNFLASDYCYNVEMKRALEKHEANEARVIPIIIRPVNWEESPFAKLQALPKDAKPISLWNNIDEAWFNVTEGIKKVCEEILDT